MEFFRRFIVYVGCLLRTNGKSDFLSRLNHKSKILDVGCGNDSPLKTKRILPNCTYTGIDICNYNQKNPAKIENYILTTSEMFPHEIKSFNGYFDAVISNHNLEHCEDRESTLEAMLSSLRIGGKLFLAFPCQESINFPSRRGTLNYYDDSTHKYEPPIFDLTLSLVRINGFEVVYSARNYSPLILRIVGLLLEPFSKYTNKVLLGTWEFYGFESIIIARRIQ